MSRLTQAQQVEHEQEQQAIAYFEGTLEPLHDPRRGQGAPAKRQTATHARRRAPGCALDGRSQCPGGRNVQT